MKGHRVLSVFSVDSLPKLVYFSTFWMSQQCEQGQEGTEGELTGWCHPSSWGWQAFPSSCHCAWDGSPNVRGPHPVTVGTEYWDQETWALVLALSLVLTFHICKVMALNLVTVKFCASPTSSESDGELQGNCMAWLSLGQTDLYLSLAN